MILRAGTAALVAAAILGAPGCASYVASSVSTGGAVRPTPPIAVVPPAEGLRVVSDGGLFVSATISLSQATANVIAGIFIVGILAADAGFSPQPAPKMREDRAINLQDCTKAIANWSANLKCATPEELRELESAQRD